MTKIALAAATLLAALSLAPVSADARGAGGLAGGGAIAENGLASSGVQNSSMSGKTIATDGSAGRRNAERRIFAHHCPIGYGYATTLATIPGYCDNAFYGSAY